MTTLKTMHVPEATAAILKSVAKMHGVQATAMLHRLAKQEAHRLGFTTVPFGWETEATQIGGKPAVYLTHHEIEAMALTADEAVDVAGAITSAAETGKSVVVPLTTAEGRQIIILDKGKAVVITIDGVTISMPRFLAFDLAEAISDAAKEIAG